MNKQQIQDKIVCHYCKKDPEYIISSSMGGVDERIRIHKENLIIEKWIDVNGAYAEFDFVVKINNCPICGRKL